MAYYKELFSISLRHSYYTSGLSGDFRLQPDAGTAALLKNYRILIRYSETGLQAVYEATNADGNPVISFDTEQRFRFYLRPANAQFSNFTDTPGIAYNKTYWFRNPNDTTPQSTDALSFYPPVFNYELPSPKTTLVINGPATSAGDGPEVVNKTGLTAGPIAVDLSAFGPGTYSVAETGEKIVVDSAVDSAVLAVIEVFASAHPVSPDKPAVHSVTFDSRSAVWRYYVVLPGAVSGTFSVTKSSGTLDGYNFSAVDIDSSGTDEEKAAADALKSGAFASGSVLLFRSADGGSGTDAIPYTEATSSGISLVDSTETASEQTLITDLPNPSVANSAADMVVYVND